MALRRSGAPCRSCRAATIAWPHDSPWRASRPGEGSAAFLQGLDELIVRVGKGFDAIALQLQRDFVQVYPGCRKRLHGLTGTLERLGRVQRARNATVVLERLERRRRQRVDRVGPNQVLDIAHIAVAR